MRLSWPAAVADGQGVRVESFRRRFSPSLAGADQAASYSTRFVLLAVVLLVVAVPGRLLLPQLL
jgi:hypothetical protein